MRSLAKGSDAGRLGDCDYIDSCAHFCRLRASTTGLDEGGAEDAKWFDTVEWCGMVRPDQSLQQHKKDKRQDSFAWKVSRDKCLLRHLASNGCYCLQVDLTPTQPHVQWTSTTL